MFWQGSTEHRERHIKHLNKIETEIMNYHVTDKFGSTKSDSENKFENLYEIT